MRGRELVLRPVGMACSLLEGEGHFILKFLGTMDGQNEVSIILEGKKKDTVASFTPSHTPFPLCPWQADLLIHSFNIYLANFCYMPVTILDKVLAPTDLIF